MSAPRAARNRWNAPGVLILSRLAAVALGFVSAPLVARALGPDGRGVLAAVLAAAFILPIVLGLGLPVEVRRKASVGIIGPELRAARDLLWMAFVPSTAAGIAIAVALLHNQDQSLLVTAAVCIALAPASLWWMIDTGVLIGRGSYGSVAILQVLPPLFTLFVVTVLFAVGQLTVGSALIASTSGQIANSVVSTLLVRVGFRGKRRARFEMLRTSLKYWGNAVADAVTNRLDQVIALPILGAYQAGLYSVAVTIGGLPAAVGQSLGGTFFRSIATTEGEARRHEVALAIRVSLLAGVLAAGLIALLAPWGVPFVFGAEFTDSTLPTLLYLIGSALGVGGYVASLALAAIGFGWRMTLAQMIGLAVGLVGLLSLGPFLGADGAAIASTVGFAAAAIGMVLGLKVRLVDLIPRLADGRTLVARLRHGV
ncbi:MAG: oligosaccharide flippase family protein [Microbacterium sp.]|nr:oligosaccharide flippase family protein [Microbacterium sp.]